MKNEKTDITSKFNIFQKIIGYFVIVLMFVMFTTDRTLHILLPHREHQEFTLWAKDFSNVKYCLARLFIFLLPIIIYNIIV